MQPNTKNLNPFSTFENHLREIRARRRVTQLRLALATQISQTKISYFENGFQLPSQEEKHRIADVLEVAMTDLFPEAK
jgi:transcriptional regulator with XRE-family HTH domain